MWKFGEQAERTDIDERYSEEQKQLENDIEKTRKEIIQEIEGFEKQDEIKEIVLNGFQMYVNGKILNFNLESTEEIPIEKAKQEVKDKYNERLQQIKTVVDEKTQNLSENFDSLKEKLEDELQNAKDHNDSFSMPKITFEHAQKGLSVVQGGDPKEIIWLYRGKYRVNTIDGKLIDQSLSKKTQFPAIMMIKTREDTVIAVKVKRWYDLENFQHYHSLDNGNTDCWGNWEYSIKWDTPDDIIDLGIHGFSILRDVNSGSPGDEAPPGLPDIDTLKGNVTDLEWSEDEEDGEVGNRGVNPWTVS